MFSETWTRPAVEARAPSARAAKPPPLSRTAAAILTGRREWPVEVDVECDERRPRAER